MLAMCCCCCGWPPPPSPLSGLGLVRFGHCVALIGDESRREPSRFSSISRNATSSAALSAWPRLHNAMGPFSEQQRRTGWETATVVYRALLWANNIIFAQDNRRWSRSGSNPYRFRSSLLWCNLWPALGPKSRDTKLFFHLSLQNCVAF